MPRRASFGFLLPSREVVLGLTEAEDVVAMAPLAEKLGFDSVWIGDSLLTKPRLDPLTTLAAAAMKTKKVKLGTAVLLAAIRNPFLLAQQWATLDRIAKGRTIMGVGIGGGRYTRELFEKEFAVCGVKFGQRMEVMEEMIEMLKILWSKDHVNYDGKFLKAEDISLNPKPLKRSCPIWISCTSADVCLRRVARLGDGWIANILHPEEFGRSLSKLQEYSKEYRRKTPEPMFYMYLNLADDKDKAWKGADDFLAAYYNTKFPKETLERWGPFGPRSLVTDRIDKTIRNGAKGLILHFASLKPKEQLKRFSKEVLPSF